MRNKITVATGHYTDSNRMRVRIRTVVDSEEAADEYRQLWRLRASDGFAYVRTDDVYEPSDIPKVSDTHFFDADSIRFFTSRILSHWRIVGHRLYFTTSERSDWDDYTRTYSVRVWDADSDSIDTIGDFGEHSSARAAARAMDKAANSYSAELEEVKA
jgi:hypothetical protein